MYVQIQVFYTLNISGGVLEHKAYKNNDQKLLGPCNMTHIYL